MKTIRVISVVALAVFLVLVGLFFLGLQFSPILQILIGISAIISGACIFIALSHWIDIRKENRR